MTLTVRLDDDEERKLQQIVEALKADSQSVVIRAMIDEKWRALQTPQTFLERRGGHPVHLLNDSIDASLRSNRKAEMDAHYAAKAAARKVSDDAQHSD